MLRKRVNCSRCGTVLPPGANFCPSCRQPTGRGKASCPHCGGAVNVGDRFCGHCGRELAPQAPPAMVGNVWSRESTDFAARVQMDDVGGFFKRSVVVEPGTQAILIQDGRNLGTMPPGKHTLDSLAGRLGLSRRGAAMAILVDVGDTDLKFDLSLYTADPVRLALSCQIVLQLENPALFLTNLMRSQRRYTLEQLREFLLPEIDDAAREYVCLRKVEELNSSVEAKRDIELDIEAHLSQTLRETGLRLVQVRTLNYRCPKLDALRDAKEDLFLEISRREAELSGRRVLFDVMKGEDIQTLAEETQKVAAYEDRAAIFEQMRRAVLSDKMNEVRSEEELEEFLQGIDRQRLIRGNEMEELKRDFAERKQDHDLARSHLVAKLSLERDYELRHAELRLRSGLSTDQVQLELDLERKRVEGKLEIEASRTAMQLEMRKQEAVLRREQDELDGVARRKEELEEALKQARIRRSQIEIERLEDQLDWETVRKAQATVRLNRQEKLRIERENQAALIEIEIRKEEAALERQLKQERARLETELARLKQMAAMSAEALIAVAGPEQAQILAGLKETEILKGMTEEQILARAAERSPEIARAFAEKFRSSPEMQQQVTALYERLLTEHKESAAAKDAQQRDVLAQIRAMFDKALETQRDVSMAYASRPSQGPTVVVPAIGGSPQVVTARGTAASGPTKVIVCAKCRAENDPNTRYCANCGAELG